TAAAVDEEMFVVLIEEETAAAADDEEHLKILACLADMYAREAKWWLGTRSPQVQAEAAFGGALHVVRRLLC
ncbi:hypothetical protein Q8G50_33180, partial [Klebsiella pneumoniae]